MTWATPLTRAGIADYFAETYDFDARLHGAYSLLMMRYSLSGPIPYDETRLAAICRVSRRIWVNRIWPVIQDLFTLGDDGLIHHEGLDALDTPTAVQARRSAAGRKAAKQRWANEAARKAREAADAHAPAHATADAIAYESHTTSQPIASQSHPIASSVASLDVLTRPPSLSLLESSTTLENREKLEGESAHASVGEAASDAVGQCDSDAHAYESHTKVAALPQAKVDLRRIHARSEPPMPVTRMTADWQPSSDGQRQARQHGYDPNEIAANFRNHYLSTGETRANWDAAFLNWIRREPAFEAKRGQGPVPAPIKALAISAPAALPEADKILMARINGLARSWTNWKAGPLPPTWMEVQTALAAGLSAPAHRWLATKEGLYSINRTGSDLPGFKEYVADPLRYEAQIAEAQAEVAASERTGTRGQGP